MNTPEQEQFLAKVVVADNGCWIWQSALSGGYAVAHMPGEARVTSGHRIAYELFVGAIPEGLQLHHECRERTCVNPSHVRPVTPSENMLIRYDDHGYVPVTHLCADCRNVRVNRSGGRCRGCKPAETLRLARERVVSAIRLYAELYGRAPGAAHWNVAMARSLGRLDLVERYESGDWPATSHVQLVFGSWSAALVAAGLPPNAVGGAGHEGRSPTHCKYGHEYTPDNTYQSKRGRSCRECVLAANRRSYQRRKVAA